MDITQCQSENVIVTTQLSLRHGEDTGPAQHLKAMLLPKIDIQIVADFAGKTKWIDDVCACTDDTQSSFFQACKLLDLCGRKGII